MDRNFWLGAWCMCIVFGTGIALLIGFVWPTPMNGMIVALCLTIWWLSYKFFCKAKR